MDKAALASPGKSTIGLALSGGAIRGIAHIGVLKALSEHQIFPDTIAGTSAGALVGALYAFGVPFETLCQEAEEISWRRLVRFNLSPNALLSNKVIGKMITKLLGEANIEDSPIPLYIIATDITTGETINLTRGNLAEAVMASTCIPGIFEPIKIGSRLLVDGFLVSNLPISPLRYAGCDIIIAVSLTSRGHYRKPGGILNILINALEIAVDTSSLSNVEDSDILIRIDIPSYSNDIEMMIEEGYQAALKAIPHIKAKIAHRNGALNASWWKKIKHALRLI